jgi:hypothetical protein
VDSASEQTSILAGRRMPPTTALDLCRPFTRVEAPHAPVLAGLPEPEVNVVVRRADGSVMLRLDLAYPHLKLAVAYDGQQHRHDLDQWARDISRADWRRSVVSTGRWCHEGAPACPGTCRTSGARTSA